jgi:aminotransferase
MNNNVQKIQISGIRRFFNKVADYPDAISLTLGEPDFRVPNRIKEAMVNAIMNDKNSYTPNMGLIQLRTAIRSYLSKMEISYKEEEICITVGGSEGLFSILNALINPGDKIVIPNPSYPAYASIATLLGANILDCELNDDFTINMESLKKVIEEEKPKLLVLSYPSNPTGAVLSKGQRDQLYNLIKDNNTIVVSDEIYCSIYFEAEYYSLAQHEDIKNKVILVGGFSKMFSMTGLRVGYVCAEKEFMDQIVKVHQYCVSCAPAASQWGAMEGLNTSMEHIKRVNESFINRRDYLYEGLKSFGMDVTIPKGAFYMFPSIKKFNMSSEEFCDALLKEGKVAVVPGDAFGIRGEGFVRISYSYSEEDLKNGLNRLEKWIKAY